MARNSSILSHVSRAQSLGPGQPGPKQPTQSKRCDGRTGSVGSAKGQGTEVPSWHGEHGFTHWAGVPLKIHELDVGNQRHYWFEQTTEQWACSLFDSCVRVISSVTWKLTMVATARIRLVTSDRGSSSRWLVLVMFGSILCLNSCERARLIAVASDTPDAAELGTGKCAMSSSSCQRDADCCSGLCQSVGSGRICQAPPTCRASGDTCATGADCCSHVCGSDNLCPPISGCAIVGEPCATNLDCCSGACSNPGTGIAACQPLDGCLPAGEICSLGSDCCSQSCLLDSTLGIGRCTPASNCAAVGEVCTNTPTGNNCCGAPPGGGGGFQGCILTSAGVFRCMAPTKTGQCMTDSSICQIHEQCCSRFCLPSASGQLTCTAGCAMVGARCGASRDCCNNASCIDGSCKLTGIACQQLGVSCGTGADCCSAVCDANKMTCFVSP